MRHPWGFPLHRPAPPRAVVLPGLHGRFPSPYVPGRANRGAAAGTRLTPVSPAGESRVRSRWNPPLHRVVWADFGWSRRGAVPPPGDLSACRSGPAETGLDIFGRVLSIRPDLPDVRV